MKKTVALSLIFILFLAACDNAKKKKEKELNASIEEDKMTLGVYEHSLIERGAFLNSYKDLSQATKAGVHYDSLTKVQLDQASDTVRIRRELDSLKVELEKLLK